MTLEQQLEGVLFYKAAPMKKAALLKLFAVEKEALEEAAGQLATRLEVGATRLIRSESELELVTAPELDRLIDSMRKDDVTRDVGKAGAETLAIVAYRGPVTRTDIDHIRGVNSSFILRTLLIRGLIQKSGEGRSVAYQATPQLLAYLGVTSQSGLPQHESIMNALSQYEANLTADTL